MNDFFKHFDAKMITASGGIVLALFLVYVLYTILTNDFAHINRALESMNGTQKETNEVLRNNASAIEGNTEVLRILERRLK